jgi:hypothetical protein
MRRISSRASSFPAATERFSLVVLLRLPSFLPPVFLPVIVV